MDACNIRIIYIVFGQGGFQEQAMRKIIAERKNPV
jgi:hypothetical protein